MKQKRHRGGQPGNQNARKHGFYSEVTTPEQQDSFPAAKAVNNIDAEIALQRVKIRAIVGNNPQSCRALVDALSSLSGLVRAREAMLREERRESKDLYRRFVSWLNSENQSLSD